MSRKSNAVFLFLRENGPMAASRLSRYGAKFPCEHRCWIDAVGAGEVTLRYRRSMSARFFFGNQGGTTEVLRLSSLILEGWKAFFVSLGITNY